MRWVVDVARMRGEMRKQFLFQSLKVRDFYEDLGVDGG
jgi:hypothetical protein